MINARTRTCDSVCTGIGMFCKTGKFLIYRNYCLHLWHSHADNSFYGRVGWECIHTKGVTERFGFDAIRISQVQYSLSKTKQRERPKGCFICTAHSVPYYIDGKGKGELYTNIGVGLSALLVSTNWAMREPL